MKNETKIEDGGQAFPSDQKRDYDVATLVRFGGMTLRDYMAAKAMQAMFNGYATDSSRAQDIYAVCAREAYAVADAMLKARQP